MAECSEVSLLDNGVCGGKVSVNAGDGVFLMGEVLYKG